MFFVEDFWIKGGKYDSASKRYFYYLHFRYKDEELFVRRPLSAAIEDESQIFDIVLNKESLDSYLRNYDDSGVSISYQFTTLNKLWMDKDSYTVHAKAYEYKYYNLFKHII